MDNRLRKLVLENGSVHMGTGFGAMGDAVCELVFNTSMVGYQEIVTDPSYTSQMVVMTYPLIGNYGITDEDYETRTPTMGAMVVREYNDLPSNFRYTKTLSEVLEEYSIPGIQGVDTRRIGRMIRSEGSQRALLTSADTPIEEAMERIRAYQLPHDCVSRVSSRKKWYARTANPRFNVVAVDCGIKLNIIRKLNEYGCNVTVVPYDTPAETIMSFAPDGLFLSNGPGDPEPCDYAIQAIRELLAVRIPIFGICLGHQLLGLASGARTIKMKFGHHGANHPVLEIDTGRVMISSQNHGFAVDEASLPPNLRVTHRSLFDGSVQGLERTDVPAFCFQGHPEASPGPHDILPLFDRFIQLMQDAGSSVREAARAS